MEEVTMYKCADGQLFKDKSAAINHSLYLGFKDEYNKNDFKKLEDNYHGDDVEFDNIFDWMEENSNFVKRIAEVI